KLSINSDADIKIYGDPLKFSQVIANLLSNAVEACEARADNINKEVNIDIRLQANKILIKIQDNGAGIKPEHQAKIWQAFFSTKTGVASGLGIGLASSKNIIEKDFLGTIEAESPETLPRLVDEAIDKDVDETEKEETND
ncbi:MAG: ATP-binding protein, partial [Candidatus Falkowbacteria bacterium]|nr:ATP-binding protein [Candidatus Falkowbacteria bacterium]